MCKDCFPNFKLVWALGFSIGLILIQNSCILKHDSTAAPAQLKASHKSVLDSLINLNNKQAAVNHLDSLYSTFGTLSVADRFNYYDYKLQFSSKKGYNFSLDSQLIYADSMIFIIEKNHMEKKMQQELTSAYNKKVSICTAWGLYEEAAEIIAKTMLLNLEMKDTCAAAENTKVLGSISFKQSKCEEAADFYKKALELEMHCPKDERQYYRTQLYLSDLALTYAENKQNDSAIKYYLEAEKYIIKNKNLSRDTFFPYEALMNVYANLGQVYRNKTKQLDLSEAYNLKAYYIASEVLHDTSTIAQINIFLADTYLMQNKLQKAEKKLAEGMSQSAFFYLEDHQLSARIGKDLALYSKNYRQYSYFTERYLYYLDSSQKLETSLQKKNPNAQYERLDKIRQVELLNKTNQIEQNKTYSALSIAGLLLVFILTLFYYFRKNKLLLQKEAQLYRSLFVKEEELKNALLEKNIQEKLKKEEDLYYQEIRLKMQNAALLFEQRQKISMDLHDNLNASIAALRFYIEDLLTKTHVNNKKDLESIKDEVNTIYQNSRNYTHNLNYNANYEEHNLLYMLEEMQKKFAKSNSVSFEIDINKNDFLHLLTRHQQDQLYYITNEALTNILKHTSASKISVVIYFDKYNCLFKITDNGTGFAVSNQKLNGLGLKGMQTRAHNLGGTITFQSDHNGTCVLGNFPLVS